MKNVRHIRLHKTLKLFFLIGESYAEVEVKFHIEFGRENCPLKNMLETRLVKNYKVKYIIMVDIQKKILQLLMLFQKALYSEVCTTIYQTFKCL